MPPKSNPNFSIHLARPQDLSAINEIYNLSIPSESSTADTEPVTMSQREAWFQSHDMARYPIYVAERDDRVIAFFSFSPHRPGREALRFTAEVSYYIHPDYQGAGVGDALMQFALEMAPEMGFKNLFAILLETNEASIGLLEKHGFKQWGRLPNVADFDGREVSQVYYGLRLPDAGC